MSATAQLRDSNGVDIPIVKVSFQSNVVDFISTTEVTIEFKNSSPSEMMEVVYTQPMDPQASLFKMVVKIGDRVIEANAREKEAAKKAYDDAKDAGHGAYLASISDDQPDVYSLSLGNVPPGETVVVMISYVTEVLLDDNRVDGSSTLFYPARTISTILSTTRTLNQSLWESPKRFNRTRERCRNSHGHPSGHSNAM